MKIGSNNNMYKIITNKFLVIGFSLMLLEGCASLNKASVDLDSEAKLFKSNPDYSTVYLYRDQILGSSLSMPVRLNCDHVGYTGPESYFKFTLHEGKHTFISPEGGSTLILDTKKGEQYFIWQEIIWGLFSGNTRLHLVSDSVGKDGVLKSSLILPSAERLSNSDGFGN